MGEKNPVTNFYRASAEDFKKIPGSPIAYWVSAKILKIFDTLKKIGEVTNARVGMMTSDNDLFLRLFWEVNKKNICFNAKEETNLILSGYRWFPHNKGGAYRKWAGNYEYLVDWEDNGRRIKNTVIQKYPYLKGDPNFVVHDDGFYFKPFVSWSEISSASSAFRYYTSGFTFNIKGMSVFSTEECSLEQILSFCNNNFVAYVNRAINPTISFGVGNFNSLPAALIEHEVINKVISRLIFISKSDWDSYETSWDFTSLPLLSEPYRNDDIAVAWKKLRKHWVDVTLEMQRLEEENNKIFIEAYGLEDELTPEVPLDEITLTCNPYYRYGVTAENTSPIAPPGDTGIDSAWPWNEDAEARLLSDTMKELISYAVGCIVGRYSLDKERLVLANAGDDIDKYLKVVPKPRFRPDESGILPITEDEDFSDDLPTQVKRFLRAAFGEECYEGNLRFIEDSIGRELRTYLLKDFYKDHVQRYKKRPIYWMISSPKGSFKTLIYLHRYHKDTVNRFLNDYLRPYQQKLRAKIENNAHIIDSASYSNREKNQARKRSTDFEKQLKELSAWEKEVVYPLASKRIELDLDDGVKVNYGKLGDILEKVTGLNG